MLARNRDVLDAAHKEIDSVIGAERLPDLEDRTSLPYIECILKETLRCVAFQFSYHQLPFSSTFRMNPPTPLGSSFVPFFLLGRG